MEQLQIDIPQTGKTLYLPQHVNQCDTQQYINFCELLFKLNEKLIDFSQFKTLATYALLGLKKGDRNINENEVEDALSNIQIISEYIDSFFEINEGSIQLKIDYEKNHIQHYKKGNTKYVGPSPMFSDVTFGEYEDGLNLFLEYTARRDKSLLAKLFATFFRREVNEKKLSYNPYHVELKSNWLNKINDGYLLGFYYTFKAFHHFFTSSAVTYAGNTVDLSIIFSEQPEDTIENAESNYPSLGMKSIGYQLAESGVYGSLKEVRKHNLWEVALRLYDIRKRDLDYKAKQKENKT